MTKLSRAGSESIPILIGHWRWLEAQGPSYKDQATSTKHQAASIKLQASSFKVDTIKL